jgi:hypothetical protein
MPSYYSNKKLFKMRKLIFFSLLFSQICTFSQVFNFGANELSFKQLIENGITYIKTGDTIFDQQMVSNLEKYWTISDFVVIEQFKRPDKNSIALFVTEKKQTRKHMMDRKNQNILVLQPANLYIPRKTVDMNSTLGYMYFNGFYDLVASKDEYRFIYILTQALNKGLTIIKRNALTGNNLDLNAKIASIIIGNEPPTVGNILILNREQTRFSIDPNELKKLNINYRLFSEDEYFTTLSKKEPNHIILYFAINTFTEIGLINLGSGELFWTQHLQNEYDVIRTKELKAIAPYFQ